MRRILRIPPRALVILAMGAFSTLSLSACDEWSRDTQEQERQGQEQRQQEPPPAPAPQP